MNELPCFIEWTHDSPLPNLLPNPAVVFGGTRLLPSFIELVAASKGGELVIASPYFAAPSRRFEQVWGLMPHRDIDLILKVRNAPEAKRAARFIARFPWRSIRLSMQANLHAKLYTFLDRDRRGGICLVGSHNLTPAACATNREAGVLFLGSASPAILRVIEAARSHILEETAADDAVVVDSCSPFHRPEAA
jgi:phosphatidylserine/phosphatidylglycerophosphate/cardiolipin synthase-like enzyme